MAKEFRAIDLYGGMGAVVERMNNVLRTGFDGSPVGLKNYLWSELDDNDVFRSRVEKFLDGKCDADYSIFEIVGSILDIGIEKILGVPDLDNRKVRDYWVDETHVNPMLISGSRPRGSLDKMSELRFYVKLRAIGKLVQARTAA